MVLGLPDPAELSVEQRLGAVQAAARLQTMLEAYQTQVAGVSDAQRDSRLFAAGTTGSMVAALTGNNRAVGSAIVGRARDLRSMPHVAGGLPGRARSRAGMCTCCAGPPPACGTSRCWRRIWWPRRR